MSKQDRQGARTPADLERKYSFGKSFAEVMGFASDAQDAAREATDAAASAAGAVGELDKKLTQEEIFNRLTNNGQAHGIYRDPETGEIYINASYLASGVISSADGTVQIDLGNNKVIIATSISGRVGKLELDADGIIGYGWDSVSSAYYKTLRIDPGGKTAGNVEEYTMITSESSGAGLAVASGKVGTPTLLGSPVSGTEIRGTSIKIGGKTVSWKDNGDGTFTLVGG